MHDRFNAWFIPWMIACSGIGGILYGYDIGVISGALGFIRQSIVMSDIEAGYIVGAVLFGGFVANLIAGYLADHFGRRTTIIGACLVFILGIATILFAHSFLLLLSARLILGVGVGIISVAIPLYLSEIAPARIRGMSITVFQLFLTFGILLAYFVDLLFTPTGNWQAMFAVLLIPVLFLLVNMILLPESPRWLLHQQQTAAALNVLSRTHPHHLVNKELTAIQQSLAKTEGGWRELFSRKLALAVFLSLFIAICNQLTGINSILQYAPTIFAQAGFQNQSHLMQATVLIGTVNFLTTIVAMLLIERVGRRGLLLLGTSLLVMMDIVLACLPHLQLAAHWFITLEVLALLVWVAGFAIGPGIVVWIIIAELVPTKVRGKNVALCICANSLTSSILASIFLPIINKLGMANTFWILGAFTLLYACVCAYLLPETKGKTLEEIQEQLQFHHTQPVKNVT